MNQQMTLQARPIVIPSTTQRIPDGGGLHRTADWRRPPSGAADHLQQLRHRFTSLAGTWHLPHRLLAQVGKHCEQCIFTDIEVKEMRKQMLVCLNLGEDMGTVDPAPPFLLHVLPCLVEGTRDPDTSLIQQLRGGVPTGCFEPIPYSGVFKSHKAEQERANLQECWLNWKAVEQNAEATDALFQVEVQERVCQQLG